jgi:hypothetical protein
MKILNWITEQELDPEEAAWRTAVDAAPWLVGDSEAQGGPRRRNSTKRSSRSKIRSPRTSRKATPDAG